MWCSSQQSKFTVQCYHILFARILRHFNLSNLNNHEVLPASLTSPFTSFEFLITKPSFLQFTSFSLIYRQRRKNFSQCGTETNGSCFGLWTNKRRFVGCLSPRSSDLGCGCEKGFLLLVRVPYLWVRLAVGGREREGIGWMESKLAARNRYTVG